MYGHMNVKKFWNVCKYYIRDFVFVLYTLHILKLFLFIFSSELLISLSENISFICGLVGHARSSC